MWMKMHSVLSASVWIIPSSNCFSMRRKMCWSPWQRTYCWPSMRSCQRGKPRNCWRWVQKLRFVLSGKYIWQLVTALFGSFVQQLRTVLVGNFKWKLRVMLFDSFIRHVTVVLFGNMMQQLRVVLCGNIMKQLRAVLFGSMIQQLGVGPVLFSNMAVKIFGGNFKQQLQAMLLRSVTSWELLIWKFVQQLKTVLTD